MKSTIVRRRAPGAALMCLLVAGGCSGPGSPLAPTQHQPATVPPSSGTQLVVHIPRRVKRGAHYVSPATASASVTIAPASGCTTCSHSLDESFGLTTGSPNCTPSGSQTLCRISLALAPGTYVGALSTYDGPLVAGKTSGRELSENASFPVSVVAGKANAANVSLYGVPQFISFLTTSSAVDLVGPESNYSVDVMAAASEGSVLVTTLDADLNTIAGPGAPVLSAASAGGGFKTSFTGSTLTLQAPQKADTNLYTLSVSVSSPACTQATGAVCSGQFNLGFEPVLAVVNGGTNNVLLLAADNQASAPLLRTIASGITTPKDVKFDDSGNLFVANDVAGAGSLLEFAPPYSGSPVTITNGIDGPVAMDLAPNGDLAVANLGGANTLVYASPYTGAPTVISVASQAVAFDASSNLWVATLASGLKRYTAASGYATADQTITQDVSTPVSIAIDNDGDLYVADDGQDEVNLYQSPYSGLTETVLAYGAPGGHGHVAVIPGNGDPVLCAAGNNEEIFTGLDFTTQLNPLLGKSPANCRGTFDGNAGMWLSDQDDNLVFGPVTAYGALPAKLKSSAFNAPGAIAAFPGAFIGT